MPTTRSALPPEPSASPSGHAATPPSPTPLIAVRRAGLWGFASPAGELVVPARYEDAGPFHDNRAAVRRGGFWGYIDTAGREVIAPTWDDANAFSEGLAVVARDGDVVTPEALRAHLAGRFAKWWLPDAIVFVDEIPRTSTGKFLKTALREQFKDWRWDG